MIQALQKQKSESQFTQLVRVMNCDLRGKIKKVNTYLFSKFVDGHVIFSHA